MNKRNAYILPVLAIGVVVTASAGWMAGSGIGKAQARRRARIAEGARARAVVEKSSGIRIGSEFPDLELSPSDGGAVTSLTQVLPRGGGILYVSPNCGSCVHAAIRFDDWLKTEGYNLSTVIVTDDPELTSAFAGLLRDSLVEAPVFCDVSQSLRAKHRMLETPAFFILGENYLRLRQAGVWTESIGFVSTDD